MIKELIDNNYIFIDNFISIEEASDLYKKFLKDIELYPNDFYKDIQCPKSLSIYNYKLFLDLLVTKINFMNEVVGEHLLPTYTYARLYSKGEKLEKHVDRPACEISVTLNIGGDKDWDIYFTKPNKEIVNKTLKVGQAIIYLGTNSEHWRNKFNGNHYGQVFLHYVRLNGPYWKYCFDKIK